MLILGLDISTSTVGYCFANHESLSTGYRINIVDIGYIDLSEFAKEQWMKKAKKVILTLTELFKQNGKPEAAQIEDNLSGFKSGFTNMLIIILLAKFNGAVSFGLLLLHGLKIRHIHPTTARKRAWGNTFRGATNVKESVLAEVLNKYPELMDKFPVKKSGKNKGDFAKQAFDMADACTLACCIPER